MTLTYQPEPGAVRAALSWGLPGTTFALPARPLEDVAWQAVVDDVDLHRGWLALAAAIAEDAWPATDAQAEQSFDREEKAAASVLLLDRSLLDLAELLDRLGVDWRVLKGPAHASLLWARPGLRSYSDVDLLVAGPRFDEVARAIEGELGGRRHNPDPLPGLIARIGKSAAFSLPNGVEVDLHRTLAEGPFGVSIVVDDLFADPQTIEVGGRSMRTLSPEAMFLHACFHSGLAPDVRRLVPRRDVAEGLGRVGSGPGSIDPGRMLTMAERWRSTAVVAKAVNDAVVAYGLEPGAGQVETWAAELVPSARERRWLRWNLSGEPASPFLETLTTGLALRSWSDRALYTRGVLFHEGHDPVTVRARRVVSSLLR